jgi:hypothetical protein
VRTLAKSTSWRNLFQQSRQMDSISVEFLPDKSGVPISTHTAAG